MTRLFPVGAVLASHDGECREEPSRVLVLFDPPGDDADRKVRAIIARYRPDHHQEAVLWKRALACAAF